jgi:hypothetical protein
MVNTSRIERAYMGYRKSICLLLMIVAMPLGADTSQSIAHMVTTPVNLAPSEWDELYFASLSDENKKMVLSIIKSNRQLLAVVRGAVFNGADAFLKAYADIVQYHSQSMTLFLPTPQHALGCTMLPCFESYRGALEVYQAHMPIIQALEIVPSIYTVWERLSEFLPTDPQANADLLKRGITKALRNKQLKVDIKQMVVDQISYLNGVIDHINTHYAQLVIEQEQLERQVEELMAKMKQEQDVAN